jgi:hypothetical protein
MIVQLDDAEAKVVLSAIEFLKEALIDDAQDDPTADHADQVPTLTRLAEKFRE